MLVCVCVQREMSDIGGQPKTFICIELMSPFPPRKKATEFGVGMQENERSRSGMNA